MKMFNWKRAALLIALSLIVIGTVGAGGKTEGTTGTTGGAAAEGKYKESPLLAAQVKAGELPPVDQRLPKEPVVVKPLNEIGKYGGIMKIGIPGPTQWYGDPESALGPETLMRLSRDYTGVVPNLIRTWEWTNDGRTLTCHFIQDAKWSDGEPFSADAVMFWYEDVLLNKELNPAGVPPKWAPGGETMKLTKLDDYTIRYDFKVPYPVILFYMAHYDGSASNWMPSHYLKQFHAEYTDRDKVTKMAKDAEFDEWYQLFNAKKQVYSCSAGAMDLPSMSAYVLDSSSPEFHSLKRNPYYWKVDPDGNQLPYIDEVRLLVYTYYEVLTLKAIQGEFSLYGQNSELSKYPVYMDNKAKGGYEVYKWVASDAGFMGFQFNLTTKDPVKREIFRDRRFRIAFSHCINREEINETQFFGLCTPMNATAHPMSPYYKEEFGNAYIEYDPAKSNKLLDEMGLDKKDSDGYRIMKDGRRLEVTLEYPPETHTWAPPVVELMVAYMKDIGIKMNVKAHDRSLYAQRVNSNDVEFNEWNVVGFTNTMLTDPRCFVPFRLGDETTWYRLWAEWYVSKGEKGEKPIPVVQKLIDIYEEYITIVDDDARIAKVQEMLQIHAEEQFIVGLIGNTIKPLLVDVNLGNVPTEGVHGYDWIRLQPQHPETFYFKN